MANNYEILRNDLADGAAAALPHNLIVNDSSRPHIKSALAKLRQKLTRFQEGGSNTLVSISDLLQSESQRTFDILVVGIAGAGKSTLVNTLLMEYLSDVSDGLCPDHTTDELIVETKHVVIGNKPCELRIWDCPGLDGSQGYDDKIIAQINDRCKIKEPDLLIICADIGAYAGRRLKNVHDYQIRKLKEVNDGKLFEHCAVAFTKANMVSEQYEKKYQKRHRNNKKPTDPEWQAKLLTDIDKCKDGWRAVFRDEGFEERIVENIPVCVFGEMEFNNETKEPEGLTAIGCWQKTWFDKNWSDLINAGKDELIMLFLAICGQFQMNQAIDPNLRLLAPDGSNLKLKDPEKRYLAYLTLGILGLGCVACAAVAPFTFGLSAVAALPVASSIFVAASALVAGSGKGITDTWDAEQARQRDLEVPRERAIAAFNELEVKVPVEEALVKVEEWYRSLSGGCIPSNQC